MVGTGLNGVFYRFGPFFYLYFCCNLPTYFSGGDMGKTVRLAAPQLTVIRTG